MTLSVVAVVCLVVVNRIAGTTGACNTTTCPVDNGECQGDVCHCVAGKFGNCTKACTVGTPCTAPKACSADGTACAACNPLCASTGKCRSTTGGPKCLCDAGYEGNDCATFKCGSDNEPCKNGGTCTAGSAGPCTCPTDWAGTICDIPACDTDVPCLNGGTCTNKVCQCTTGFTGDRCQTIKCGSDNEPCKNDGTCTEDSSNPCSCGDDYAGDICEIAACGKDDPCLNGGKCLEKLCECTDDFSGDRCQNGGTMIMASFLIFFGTAVVATGLW